MRAVFGIGETELILILAFAFMVFGPDKLPGMGRTLGRALRQFRHAQEGFTQVVQSEVIDPATEAMGVDGKKPNRKRSEEFEEDADLEVAEGGEAPAPKRTETFAERKKRLAEEKAARDAAEREAAEAAKAAASDTDDAAGEKDAPADEAPAAPAEPEPAPEPKKPTAADLYSMTAKTRHDAPSSAAASAPGDGVSPAASHEVSEPQGERRASGADPAAGSASSTTEKEA